MSSKPPIKPPADDLFESSTMTFGQHLEELRTALVRSLLGLAAGCVIGLLFANRIVEFIQQPMVDALQQHIVQRDLDKLKKDYKTIDDKELGVLKKFMLQHEFTYEYVLVEPQQLERLRGVTGGAANSEAEASDASRLALTRPELPSSVPTMMVRLWKPMDVRLNTFSAQEAFMIWMKAGVIGGFILASPYIFYQLWMFVAAGLYPHERKYIHIYLPFSIGLFLAGAALAFFVVFDYVLNFLFTFNSSMGLDADPRISEWISFVLILPVGFGIAFQLPLAMLLLNRVGILTVELYLSKWRLAVVVIFFISMLLTPADPISMLAMAMPLCALYFLGIAMCHWMPRSKSPFGEGYDPS